MQFILCSNLCVTLHFILTIMYLHCSDFLYEISQPDKEGFLQVDLSANDDIILDSELVKSFSPKQLAIEYVIAKVFVRHRCDIVVTDRLGYLFMDDSFLYSILQRRPGYTVYLCCCCNRRPILYGFHCIQHCLL